MLQCGINLSQSRVSFKQQWFYENTAAYLLNIHQNCNKKYQWETYNYNMMNISIIKHYYQTQVEYKRVLKEFKTCY